MDRESKEKDRESKEKDRASKEIDRTSEEIDQISKEIDQTPAQLYEQILEEEERKHPNLSLIAKTIIAVAVILGPDEAEECVKVADKVEQVIKNFHLLGKNSHLLDVVQTLREDAKNIVSKNQLLGVVGPKEQQVQQRLSPNKIPSKLRNSITAEQIFAEEQRIEQKGMPLKTEPKVQPRAVPPQVNKKDPPRKENIFTNAEAQQKRKIEAEKKFLSLAEACRRIKRLLEAQKFAQNAIDLVKLTKRSDALQTYTLIFNRTSPASKWKRIIAAVAAVFKSTDAKECVKIATEIASLRGVSEVLDPFDFVMKIKKAVGTSGLVRRTSV
jgi:hypothetical protein